MNSYSLGNTPRIAVEFLVEGVGTDPTTLTLTITDPNDVETVFTFGTGPEIVKDSAGHFHAEYTPPIAGTYIYRWVGTGTASGSDEDKFDITSLEDDSLPGVFITGPDDYDSIRALLGVEVVDVEDVIIELPAYKAMIEARIVGAVPDYALLMEMEPGRTYLKAAAYYGIAAALAESYVKGGTVSLVHEEMPRRNWSEWARIFWNRYEEFVSQARFLLDPLTDDDAMPMVLLAGPTRAYGGRHRDWRSYPPVWPTRTN